MSNQADADPIKLLTFRLGPQDYALDIMSVREIRAASPTTTLPHAPCFIKGVINLRGMVLAVIDLANRLGLPAPAHSDRKVIIVVSIDETMTGLLVDAVSDIVTVNPQELQSPPDMPHEGTQDFLHSLTLYEDRLVRILDLAVIVGPVGHAAA